jgi:exosortase
MMFSSQSGSMRNWFLVVAVVAVAVAYAPMLTVFYQQLWYRPHTQFFPFVIAAFIGLFWSRWRSATAPTTSTGWPRVAAAFAFIAWLTLVIAVAIYNPWLSAASLNLLLAAVCIVVAGQRNVTYLWGIWALLILLLPLPLGLDQQFISGLQLVSSRWSSTLLDYCGVLHVMQGNTLQLPQKQLFVDEACSGIVSVMSIVACGMIYGVWRNRPPLHIILLVAAGIFWAVLLNVLRITIIALALEWFQLDWSHGTSHEILGLCLFLIAFGGLISTDVLIAGMLAPIEEAWPGLADTKTYGKLLVRGWDAIAACGSPGKASTDADPDEPAPTPPRWVPPKPAVATVLLTAAFAMVGVLQIGVIAWASGNPIPAARALAPAKTLERTSLPDSLAGIQCVGFTTDQRERDNIFGEYSKIYEYRDSAGQVYQVSCDFPFSQGWHELTVCYRGAGWEIDDRRMFAMPGSTTKEPWTAVEAVLVKPGGTSGFVTWAIFDENGAPVSPPLGELWEQVWRLLVRRSPLIPTRQLFQVQVYTTRPGEISEDQKRSARQLLLEAREQMQEIIAPKHHG